MKTIVILVPESSVIQAIADPQYAFSAVNQFLYSANQKPLFDVVLVGQTNTVLLNDGLYTVHPNATVETAPKADLIIVPALFGDLDDAVEKNQVFVEYLKKEYKRGTEIASLCVGAFLLAETGLLDGKNCSTHWGFQNQFRKKYPNVRVLDGQIVTEESGLYSSGGANSYWNLLLHLLEKMSSRELAVLAAKYFAIDIDRTSQNSFAIFQGQKSHDDNEIMEIQKYIESKVEDKLLVDDLAEKAKISRRSFERRFKKATNNTVLEYIQRIRVERAKRLFENSRKNHTDVMYEVGYSDPKAFRAVFKKVTGMTPKEYRDKYTVPQPLTIH